MNKLIITPKTKIYELLEAYPQLEEILIEMAPPFKKLKNTVLRKTVAKITTLNQASVIAGLNVEVMVNKLRDEVGQNNVAFGEHEPNYTLIKPLWFSEDRIVKITDVRDMLHDGEQPVHEVLSSIKQLKDGEILKVIAPFLPAPLLDKSISLEFEHWIDKKSEELVIIYFIN